MNEQAITRLLAAVREGAMSLAEAKERLAQLPFESLSHTIVDHHRELRQGTSEVVYAAGKTPAQVADIAKAMLGAGHNVLCTRASEAHFKAVHSVASDASYLASSQVVQVVRKPAPLLGRVGIVCAGTSDLPVAHEALECARFFGAECSLIADVGVAGLHRLLARLDELRKHQVLIVVAGMEGALPSVLGGLVAQPVIAVPTSVGYGVAQNGMTAMHAMLTSCAAGITVVNIDNGFGAAAAAARILRTINATPPPPTSPARLS